MMNDKIDAIAEKVMGWAKSDVYVCCWQWFEGDLLCHRDMNHFNPYESWADCGMVIDRMKEWGFVMLVDWCHRDIPSVVFSDWYKPIEHSYTEQDLKTAICEAALEAVE